MICDEDPLRRRPRESTARRKRQERCVWIARKMTEWPSKRGPITKIMPSDGCIGDTVPLAVGKWYDFHEFGWYMGNVGLIIRLFSGSTQKGVLGLQFEDEIVYVGSGDYVCTIAPPSFWRMIRLMMKPDFRVPSYYTLGYWCCERVRLYNFLQFLTSQPQSFLFKLFGWFDRSPVPDFVMYRLFPMKVKKNIALHYNTSPEFMGTYLAKN